jgi:predicted naringenin-chalcone synthase
MATGSVVIPDSMDSMSWKVGDHGFEMLLTSDVGDKIEAALNQWLVQWLDTHGYAMNEIDFWGVHPGGPRILDAVQASLGLTDESLKTSRSVLSSHGNMSSPTVLFILNEFVQQHQLQQNRVPSAAVLLAFGPGLVAEIALIKVNP